jgi:hypothetical protein
MNKTMRAIGMLAAGLILAAGVSAAAPFTITSTSVSAAPGSSGNYFDVNLTTGATNTQLGAFTFGIAVASPSIVFTSSGMNTAMPYAFAGDSFTQITLGLSNNDTTAGGQTIIASDLSDSGAGTLLLAGSTVGLGRVFFNVSPTALNGETIALTFLAFPTTSVSDTSAVELPVATQVAGNIVVVPEPGTLLPAGVMALWLVVRRRQVGRPVD